MARSSNRYDQLNLLSYTVEPQEAGEELPQLAEPPQSIDQLLPLAFFGMKPGLHSTCD